MAPPTNSKVCVFLPMCNRVTGVMFPPATGPGLTVGNPVQRSPVRCLSISKPPTGSQLLCNARDWLSGMLSSKVLSGCALALPARGRDHSQDALIWGAHSVSSLNHTSRPQPEAGVERRHQGAPEGLQAGEIRNLALG